MAKKAHARHSRLNSHLAHLRIRLLSLVLVLTLVRVLGFDFSILLREVPHNHVHHDQSKHSLENLASDVHEAVAEGALLNQFVEAAEAAVSAHGGLEVGGEVRLWVVDELVGWDWCNWWRWTNGGGENCLAC